MSSAPCTQSTLCFRRIACAWALCGILISLTSVSHATELRRSPIVKAVEEAGPSVVNIHGRKTLKPDQNDLASTEREVNGMGTGVVIDERGYILTNFHVVDGVVRIQVTLHDGRTLVGRQVAHDTKTDLAIIKVDVPEKLAVIRMGTSSDLLVGESVIAVGNAYGYEHTVTRGIVSALHRPVQVSDTQKYHDLIQTDASINPGNSGGPLMNIDGDVIGINVAVRVGAQGIGFAIPIDEAMDVAAQLLNVERINRLSHGIVGRTERDSTTSRFVVTSVQKGSAAEAAGLRSGDVVVQIDEQPVQRALDFERRLVGRRLGEEVALEIRRGDQALQVALGLGELEDSESVTLARTWEVLGLKLTPMAASAVRQISPRYRGGLKVVAVRSEGPAANQGIRPGDVLVGMHKWETVTLSNVAFILNSEELPSDEPVKFYILRGSETLYGHLRVSMNPTR